MRKIDKKNRFRAWEFSLAGLLGISIGIGELTIGPTPDVFSGITGLVLGTICLFGATLFFTGCVVETVPIK